jgi:16S rRNA (guanine527-N7)-methyltransferase
VRDRVEQAAGRAVSRETFEKLSAYVALLKAESAHQNLISAATLANIWDRHILDSAQLVRFEPRSGASWVDVGSGAGLPGIVVSCIAEGPVTLLEARRLRADFLHKVVESLEIGASVVWGRAERLEGSFDVITARAVAPLAKLLELSHHLSTGKSSWILPKGRNAQSELAEARRAWQGMFHVKQSLTNADSRIIVATGVEARRKR